LLHWPLLLVERERDALIVEQIVPRTFLRTRVVFHAIGGAGAAASLEARAQTLKAESEALQQQRAAGSMPDVSSGRIAHLWERLDEALAHDTGA
jgi:DNA-binding transcriptional regulator LsrR (DeoR family)